MLSDLELAGKMPELPANLTTKKTRSMKTTKGTPKAADKGLGMPNKLENRLPSKPPQPTAPRTAPVNFSALYTADYVEDGDVSSGGEDVDLDAKPPPMQQPQQPEFNEPEPGSGRTTRPRPRRVYAEPKISDSESSGKSGDAADTSDSEEQEKWRWVETQLKRRSVPALPVHANDVVLDVPTSPVVVTDPATVAARTELMACKPYRKLTFHTKKLVKRLRVSKAELETLHSVWKKHRDPKPSTRQRRCCCCCLSVRLKATQKQRNPPNSQSPPQTRDGVDTGPPRAPTMLASTFVHKLLGLSTKEPFVYQFLASLVRRIRPNDARLQAETRLVYSEFMEALCMTCCFTPTKLLEELFFAMDVTNNGLVTKEGFLPLWRAANALGGNHCLPGQPDIAFNMFDHNRDGVIHFDEWYGVVSGILPRDAVTFATDPASILHWLIRAQAHARRRTLGVSKWIALQHAADLPPLTVHQLPQQLLPDSDRDPDAAAHTARSDINTDATASPQHRTAQWYKPPPFTCWERTVDALSRCFRYLCCSRACLRDHCTPTPDLSQRGVTQGDVARATRSLAVQRLRQESNLLETHGNIAMPVNRHGMRVTLRGDDAELRYTDADK